MKQQNKQKDVQCCPGLAISGYIYFLIRISFAVNFIETIEFSKPVYTHTHTHTRFCCIQSLSLPKIHLVKS